MPGRLLLRCSVRAQERSAGWSPESVGSSGVARKLSQEIVGFVQQRGTLERTRDLARHYGEKAKRDLRAFPDGLARRALETLPDLILARDR